MRKGFLKNLVPDAEFRRVTQIPKELFAEAKLIIFDVDNTLFFSDTTDIDSAVREWFLKVSQQYECILVSNSNTINKRAEKLANILGCKVFLSKYHKPSKKLFLEIKKAYQVQGSGVVVVGDRIFTDILFGNRHNAKTILVQPLSSKEHLAVKMARLIEKTLLFLMKASRYNK